MSFELVPGSFSNLKNYDSNWKKLLGFRNLLEKLENYYESPRQLTYNQRDLLRYLTVISHTLF